MSIHIQKLQVQNLGPIGFIQETLGLVNLFYGKNESGKTFLVEYLLRSIFRQSKNWALREEIGKGSILVQGIETGLTSFHPAENRKIEHYLEDTGEGLPTNLARLIVVKSGELDLAANSLGGVNRATLRKVLTNQELLDQIWDAIPSTVQSATLENGKVLGKNMGMLKIHSDLYQEIQDINELLNRIENHYSLGPAREIEKSIENAQIKYQDQLKAKRHQAYKAGMRLAELEQQRDQLNKVDLQHLRDSITIVESIDRDIKALKSKLKHENKQSKNYPWIESALEIWEGKSLENKSIPHQLIGVSGLVAIGIGSALMIIEGLIPSTELFWIGAVSSGIGLGLSLYFGFRMMNWSSQIEESSDRKSIRAEYEKKFGQPLQGLADLKSRKTLLQKIHISAQTTQSLLVEKQNQRKLKKGYIDGLFTTLSDLPVNEKIWRKGLAELNQKSEQLDNNIMEGKLLLSKLDIPVDDYIFQATEAIFDPDLMQALESEIEDLKSSLADLQANLDSLKARACERTGDDIQIPWQDLLYSLQALQEKKTKEYKDLVADIIAKIGLVEVLTQLREDEDRKINQAINADHVASLLANITGRYKKLDLIDDQVFVHDEFSKYALSDLSTGAREQVQLALRLGIASQICEGNPLFLILDDAFQHSDWDRREQLVKSTLDLAQEGWQILYLSMDDHIRDLFIKIVKPSLKDDFRYIQLD